MYYSMFKKTLEKILGINCYYFKKRYIIDKTNYAILFI